MGDFGGRKEREVRDKKKKKPGGWGSTAAPAAPDLSDVIGAINESLDNGEAALQEAMEADDQDEWEKLAEEVAQERELEPDRNWDNCGC